MALNNVADVQITRETAAVTRVGFGTLLFIYDTASAPSDRVVAYGSLEEVLDDFADTTEVYKAAAAYFGQELKPETLKVAYRNTSGTPETYAAVIAAAQNADPDWYALAIASRAAADIATAAATIEAMDKLFLAVTADADVMDSGDSSNIALTLTTAAYSRTALIYHAAGATEYAECAWAGLQLPKDPGSTNWAFKTLAGITAGTFTSAQITTLEARRVSRYERVAGVNVTQSAFTSDAGAFIDIIHGIDWLRQRMAEDLFERLANVEKIPYTSAGIAIVESVVRARLRTAINQGVIDDDENLTVTVPTIASTEFNDRANRILRNVNFTARLSGCINKIIVRGKVTA